MQGNAFGEGLNGIVPFCGVLSFLKMTGPVVMGTHRTGFSALLSARQNQVRKIIYV